MFLRLKAVCDRPGPYQFFAFWRISDTWKLFALCHTDTWTPTITEISTRLELMMTVPIKSALKCLQMRRKVIDLVGLFGAM